LVECTISIAFISGALILSPYTQFLGWFFAGNYIAMTVFSSFLIQRKFPTGFLYQAKHFASSDLLLFWGLVGLCAGAWSLFHGLLAAKISDYQQAQIKLLERQKQDSKPTQRTRGLQRAITLSESSD
jgi:hypothetical protein